MEGEWKKIIKLIQIAEMIDSWKVPGWDGRTSLRTIQKNQRKKKKNNEEIRMKNW